VNVVVALALAGMAYILAVFATRTIELAEVRQLAARGRGLCHRRGR
jgi:hypothetical protein